MTTYIVTTTGQSGDEIILKRTDKYEEALDYCEQCERGSLRYAQRNPNAILQRFNLREVTE
jgi:hypothetical protein